MPSVIVHPPSQLPISDTGISIGNMSEEDLRVIIDEQLAKTQYVHTQTTPSDKWVITHNLNKYPDVAVYVYRDDVLQLALVSVVFVNMNTVEISPTTTETGKAVLS